MKEMCSVAAMADANADNDSQDGVTMRAEMKSIDDSPCQTSERRVSLLDWAERLIQMTVFNEGVSSDEQISHSFPGTHNHERIQGNMDQTSSASTRTRTSSPPSDDSHTNTKSWQELHLEDCLTLIDADSDTLKSCPPPSSADNISSLNSLTAGIEDSSAFAGCDAISSQTGKTTAHLVISSPASHCVTSNDGHLLECDSLQASPASEMHLLFPQPFDTHRHRGRQLRPDSLAVVGIDQLKSPISDSFFNDDIDATYNSVPPVLTTSSSSATDHTLNTPVFEAYPPLKSSSASRVAPSCLTDGPNQFLPFHLFNDSHSVSLNIPTLSKHSPTTRPHLNRTSGSHNAPQCATSDSLQHLSRDSSTDTRTLSLDTPETNVDLEDNDSDVHTSTTPARALDDQTPDSYSSTFFPEADPLNEESDVVYVWTEPNAEDTEPNAEGTEPNAECTEPNAEGTEPNAEGTEVLISSAIEECSVNSSFQSVHVQSCLNTPSPKVEESLPQTVNNGMVMCNYEIVELPLDFWTNLSDESHTQQDISEHVVSQPWSLDSVSPGQDDFEQETMSSECVLVNLHATEDPITNSDFHNYCIDAHFENRPGPAGQGRGDSASNSVPHPGNTQVTSHSRFSNKRCATEASQSRLTIATIYKTADGKDAHSDNYRPKHIIHPKHRTKKPNASSVTGNRTVKINDRTIAPTSGKLDQYILPWPQNTELSDQRQKNKSTERPLHFATAALPISKSPQMASLTSSLHPSFCDVSSDALLSPDGTTSSLLRLDSWMSSEERQTRTSSDASGFSVEGSDFNSSFLAPSYTDRPQGQPTGEKLKETLRSRLTAKRKIDVTSQKNAELQERGKFSKFCFDAAASPYPGCTSDSSATRHESHGRSNVGLVTFSEQGSDSCSSTISQDEGSDSDSMDGRDEEDSTSSTQTSGHWGKGKSKLKDGEGTQLAQRERNRLAAQKCRKRKNDKVDKLTQQVQRLELKQDKIKNEVARLEFEREELQEMLRLHSFFCARDGMKKK